MATRLAETVFYEQSVVMHGYQLIPPEADWDQVQATLPDYRPRLPIILGRPIGRARCRAWYYLARRLKELRS